ncbi:MAG: N-acetylmuramic acid 6-phosphate etherase, partial [Sphingobacterium sp.]
AVMIQLGRVKGNKMVDMQLSNHKLVGRGVRIIMDQTGATEEDAAALLEQFGNVRQAIEAYQATH